MKTIEIDNVKWFEFQFIGKHLRRHYNFRMIGRTLYVSLRKN